MEQIQTFYEHITINSKNKAFIAETNLRVSQLVAEKRAYGWSPEELHFQHPYLSLGQIYAALAYYSDHTEGIDQEIQEDLHYYNELKNQSPSPPFIKKLRKKRL